MNYSLRSNYVLLLIVSVAFLVMDGGPVVAQQAGGGGGGGGDSAQVFNFVPSPINGFVDGSITFLDPNGTVAPTFPFWQESVVMNGTNDMVIFIQTVDMFDFYGNPINSVSYALPVPANMAALDWTITKMATLEDGLYSLEGELGYLDSNGNLQSLDDQDEEFMVLNN